MPRSVDTNVVVLPSGIALQQGLDIVAGDNTTGTDIDRIRWIRTSDGASVAEIYGADLDLGGGHHETYFTMSAQADGVDGIQPVAQLGLFSWDDGSGAEVRAVAGSKLAVIIESTVGGSSFPVLPAPAARSLIVGNVSGAGIIQTGSGYHVARTGVGKYQIDFDSPMASTPTIVVSAMPSATNATNNASVPTRTPNGFTVETTDPGSAAFQDIQFDFFALG